jgi:beta-N-acetylhexosaminidase
VNALRQGRRAGIAAVACAAVLLGGCGGDDEPARTEPDGLAPLGLPLEQAVAQVFAVGFGGTAPSSPGVARLGRRAWGAVVLSPGNVSAPGQARTLARGIVRAGVRRGRPAPLIVSSSPTTFPGVNYLQPVLQTSANEAREQARRAGEALRAAGVNLAFAPDADLGIATGPAEDTAFGDDPRRVARMTSAAAEGWTAGGVAVAPGHFPGEGAASRDPAEGLATVGLSLDELRKADVRPFRALARTVPAIQFSNATYVAFDGVTPASLLPEAHELLRENDFDRVAVTGDLVAATGATGASVGRAAVDALRAGADLLYVPGDAANQEEAYRAVLRAVRRREIQHNRLAEAVRRVSELKRAARG